MAYAALDEGDNLRPCKYYLHGRTHQGLKNKIVCIACIMLESGMAKVDTFQGILLLLLGTGLGFWSAQIGHVY